MHTTFILLPSSTTPSLCVWNHRRIEQIMLLVFLEICTPACLNDNASENIPPF